MCKVQYINWIDIIILGNFRTKMAAKKARNNRVILDGEDDKNFDIGDHLGNQLSEEYAVTVKVEVEDIPAKPKSIEVKRGRMKCEHGREKSKCKDCGGSSICKHEKIRSRCKECKNKPPIMDPIPQEYEITIKTECVEVKQEIVE